MSIEEAVNILVKDEQTAIALTVICREFVKAALDNRAELSLLDLNNEVMVDLQMEIAFKLGVTPQALEKLTLRG